MTTASTPLKGLAGAALTAVLGVAVASCAVARTEVGPLAGSGATGSGATCPRGTGFDLSLASDTGGRPTPLAAATWFAEHDGNAAPLPTDGWVVRHQGEGSATVTSGSWTLEVIQGSDATWQVVSGHTCG